MRLIPAVTVVALTLVACSGSTEPKDLTAPARIALSQDTLTVYQGLDFALPAATVYNGSGQVLAQQVTWTGSDPANVQLFTNGFGRAGQTLESMTLTATAGKVSTTAKLTIALEPVTGVQFNPPYPAVYGHDSVQIVADPYGPFSSHLTGRPIAWTSLDPSVATVTVGGLAKATGIGIARFKVTIANFTDTLSVTADKTLVASVVVLPSPLMVVPGDNVAFYDLHTYDAFGTELFNRKIKWSSSDTSVVTMTALGNVANGVGVATLIAQADTASAKIPVTVARVSFTTVTAGSDHACALTAAHRAWCWGSDYLGGLGDTPHPPRDDSFPVPVVTSQTFLTLQSGGGYTCALAADGTPWCWGRIEAGENGSVLPAPLSGVKLASLSLQWNRACGLDAAGTTWCWGPNGDGLVFTKPTGCGSACDWTPVKTGIGYSFASVSAGPKNHSCALDSGGAAYCWGTNGGGQLGNNSLVDDAIPVAVSGGLTFTQVAAGFDVSCGVTTANDAYCWGSDGDGMLGTGVAASNCLPGSNPCSKVPVAVAGGLKFTSVSLTSFRACGLGVGGAVWCWGNNSGNGTPSSPQALPGGLSFTSLEVNWGYTCGIATDGKAYCWNGTSTPVAVPGQ